MPKHPISPPYKSSLAVSKSKEIEKHMTTIPKPIVNSKWKSWNIEVVDLIKQEPFSKWSSRYDPPESRYLLYLMSKEM